jgi:Na+-driven multidrug efflux pump
MCVIEQKMERIALLKKLIFCALPICATSVLQQLFNTVDMAVVSHGIYYIWIIKNIKKKVEKVL